MRLVLWLFVLALGLQAERVMLATTTSTANTGLLDHLAPILEVQTGLSLRWVALGSGQALALGRSCDVDVVLTHDPAGEAAFEAAGFGVDKRHVMANDFVLVGPKRHAVALGDGSIIEALESIRRQGVPFISRGDRSGTHAKELWLWDQSALGRPQPRRDARWYFEAGHGMIQSLVMAEEREAVVLTDRATYLKYRDTRGERPRTLAILHEGDGLLQNPYTIMAVSPQHCGATRYDAARLVIEWFTSDSAREAIAAFSLLGQPLFFINR